MSNLRVPDVNVVILAGRLTRDAEMRYTPSGRALAQFRLATNRRFRSSSGEWQDDVTYTDIRLWGEAAERMKARLLRGAPVLVEGRLRSREWETKEGNKRSGMEVVARRIQFLESAGAGAGAETSETQTETPSVAETSNVEVAAAEVQSRDEEPVGADLEGVSF